MDTANPERTISREVPRSPATDSPSTQADMSNNPTPPNAAEREQSEQPQSNNRRVSAPIERGSGLLSAMLRRLATFAIALVAVLVSIVTWDLYVTAPWTRDGRIRVQVASVAPEVAGKIKVRSLIPDEQGSLGAEASRSARQGVAVRATKTPFGSRDHSGRATSVRGKLHTG